MKKASQILFLIGGIVAIIMAIVWLVVAIVDFVYAGASAALAAGETDVVTAEMQKVINTYCNQHGFVKGGGLLYDYEAASVSYATSGVIFLLVSIFSIPAAVLSFIARKDNAKMGLIITALVFAAISWNPISMVGGVLGIVDCAVNKK